MLPTRRKSPSQEKQPLASSSHCCSSACASLHGSRCSAQRARKSENGGARQSTSGCPPSPPTGSPSLQRAHKPPSGILLPFLGLGAAILLSPLAPFVLLVSTLPMAMTQGTQQGLGLHATCRSFALEWVCGTLQLSLLQNACLVSPLRLIRVHLVCRLPQTPGRLVNHVGQGRSIAHIFRLCPRCRATTCQMMGLALCRLDKRKAH